MSPESSYPKSIETIYADVEDPTYLINKRSRYKIIQESMTQISPFLPDKGNLLEVGSYCGLFLDTFSKKYKHYVSIHYLAGKKIAILASWLEKTLNVARSTMPQKIMIPISFGGIKLYVCEKEKQIVRI